MRAGGRPRSVARVAANRDARAHKEVAHTAGSGSAIYSSSNSEARVYCVSMSHMCYMAYGGAGASGEKRQGRYTGIAQVAGYAGAAAMHTMAWR